MIQCNLAVLMAERGLKITKVSLDTGISRTTLTALYYNYSQGIQFDTMDTLCLYFDIPPKDFISFVPVSLSIKGVDVAPQDTDGSFKVTITVLTTGQQKIELFANTSVLKTTDENASSDYAATVVLENPADKSSAAYRLYETMVEMPVSFKTKVSHDIAAAFAIKSKLPNVSVSVVF
ncbi:MAG: helix-turn-helix transcriptional regulator [Ruthenibacterium sp.]